MSIKIGDNNKIKKSNIIDNSKGNIELNEKITESFANRHVVLIGVICSIIAAIIMMLPFWDKVSAFIKSLF